MTTDNALDYLTVMRAVSRWSVQDRIRLMQAVLLTLEPPEPPAPGERPSTFERALGLLATDGPPLAADPSQSGSEPRDEKRRRALWQLWGLLAPEDATPSDADVQHMIDEARMRKYG